MNVRHRAVLAAVTLTVGLYDLWAVRAAGYRFEWGRELPGYYDYLGRAFAGGHLYLPIQPAPELLAMSNPWDPATGEQFKMHDLAFYRGHYFLYHGAGPAVMLFAPWRILTGTDLPENFALFLFCFGGFLFSCGALWNILRAAKVEPSPGVLALYLFALGLAQGVPYLLSRVWVYEIAIAGGYFCLSAALFFLSRGTHSLYSLAASGLMFGLAIACRPHLGLAGAIALVALVLQSKQTRPVFCFAVPFLFAGLSVAAYNYARFDNPLEFGIRYLLAGPNQNRVDLSPRNVPAGVYFFLLSPPRFEPVFPFLHSVFRYPFDSAAHPFPPGYFIEPTAGALFLGPLVAGMLLIWKVRSLAARVAALSSLAILVFLTFTQFATERYIVDFLPVAILAAVSALAVWSVRRKAATSIAAILIAYGVFANLALGISGPYSEMLQNRPASYVRLARFFSPFSRFRPLLNPTIRAEFTARVAPQDPGVREPLLTIGDQHYWEAIRLEHLPQRLRIIAESEDSKAEQDVDGTGPLRFQIDYRPETKTIAVIVNGAEILTHTLKALVTAPSQVTVGENLVERDVRVRRFTGQMDAVSFAVAPLH
jgi:hypothetical protein